MISLIQDKWKREFGLTEERSNTTALPATTTRYNLTTPSPHLGPTFLEYFLKLFGMVQRYPNKFQAQDTARW